MITTLRHAAAYACYWLGDLISTPAMRWAWLYPAYNRLMSWSVQLDREERIWERSGSDGD